MTGENKQTNKRNEPNSDQQGIRKQPNTDVTGIPDGGEGDVGRKSI